MKRGEWPGTVTRKRFLDQPISSSNLTLSLFLVIDAFHSSLLAMATFHLPVFCFLRKNTCP